MFIITILLNILFIAQLSTLWYKLITSLKLHWVTGSVSEVLMSEVLI